MPLLGRFRFILLENLQDDLVIRPESGSWLRQSRAVLCRLASPSEHVPNLAPRMMKRASNLPNTHPIAMSASNSSIIVHSEHP